MNDVQMVLCFMLAWKDDDAAMHAMFALTRRCLSAGLALDVGVKLKHSLSLDHDPGDPSISYGEHQKQAHNGACAKVEELHAKGKRKKHAGGEDIDGPFESHGSSLILTEFNGFEVLQIRSRFLNKVLSG